MKQVLEVFELVSIAEATDGVIWNLKAASTNSPLTIEAEAVSFSPEINVDAIARAQKAVFAKNFRALSGGDTPIDWIDNEAADIARRVLRRNMNGIGATAIELGEGMEELVITPTVADVAVKALDVEPREDPFWGVRRPREEYGSIDGRLIEITTHYKRPAIRIQERKTDAIVWCRVSEALRDQIHRLANTNIIDDLWDGRRVRVSGLISYDANGHITRAIAHKVSSVNQRDMSLDEIHDPDFTGGLSAAEYLERLRNGDFGGKA